MLQPTMKAELIPMNVRQPNGTFRRLDLDFALFAFTQHTLRELRAHTSMWTETLRSTAPPALIGRAGAEHLRANVADLISGQTAWPFNLAGDSGATLFTHRAWLSWRYLALLELSEYSSVWQLPLLSTDLQSLIEKVRSCQQSDQHIDANRTGSELALSWL